MRIAQSAIFALGCLGLLAAGCGGGGGHGGGGGPIGGTPSISNLNGSTNPSSPVGVPIEIVGTNFGTGGTVKFTEGATVLSVAPSTSAAWSNTDILVTVPTGLAAPGSASVTVVTASGTSNAVNLNVVTTPTFNPSVQTWATPTPLPVAMRAHQATSVTVNASQAWIYVIGGNNGTANVTSVIVASSNNAGTLAPWAQVQALPAARAFPAVAEADATNSKVPTGRAILYCMGGQATATDAPGGTNTVFFATVDPSNGGTTTWTSTTSLPETRVGAKASVANGFVYVTGGLNASGVPIAAVASAPINADGTLGAWNESGNASLPSAVAFHESYAFGGFLYVIDGDTATSTAPFSNTAPSINQAFFAPIRQGVVGTWTATATPAKARSKFAILASFGQIAIYEGLYAGAVGSSEGEVTTIQGSGTLGSWNGLTGSNTPALNTYDTAGVATQLVTPGGKPVWFLIGGDNPTTPNTPVATIKQGP